ncbi:ester cyclase [Haloarchaeobius sp. DT45]|uniref:ester cyclase n=1 Tax=Haloarchaeobius sp. DT45 TaxID=3446116 RepID=UPI003F6D75F2
MAPTDTTLIDRYSEIIRDVVDGINAQDLTGFDDYFAADLETEIPYGWSGDYATGYDEFEAMLEDYFTAFPDFEIEAESFTASGEWTFTWLTFSGTHEGSFWGFEPSGESFATSGFWINRFEDETIVESFGWFDLFDLLTQLGYEFSFDD